MALPEWTKNRKQKVRVVNTEPSKAKQSFKAECDVNNILARYQKTGVLEFRNQNEPRYGEVPVIDYREALIEVRKAETMFMELPSSVRKRFKNDPGELLAFVQDPANRTEGERLGLFKAASTPIEAGGTPAAPAASAPAGAEGVTAGVSDPSGVGHNSPT